MLEGELSDPRIAPSHVTDVVLAPGGKSARIYVAVHGTEEEEESTAALPAMFIAANPLGRISPQLLPAPPFARLKSSVPLGGGGGGGAVLQLTATLVTSAEPIVPLPLATLQLWPLGLVLTVTL